MDTSKRGGNEFIINGDSIHNTWKTAWPKAIARAWNIEYELEKKYNIESGMNDLRTIIDKSIEKLTKLLKKQFDSPDPNDPKFKSALNSYLTENSYLNNNSKYNQIKETLSPTEEEKEDEAFKKMLSLVLDESNISDMNKFYETILEHFKFEDKKQPEKDGSIGYTSHTESHDSIRNTNYEHDLLWYKKLLCHKSEMVLDALKEEGFIVDAMENPPTDFDRNCSTRLIVRKHDQPYVIEPKRRGDNKYEQQYKRTTRTSVSYWPVNTIKRTEQSNSDKSETATNPPFKGLGDTFEGEGKNFKGSLVNGWCTTKGLGHVLVLTLPPRPIKPQEFGLAVIDYEAAGKVYSFTCGT